jgi:hypothetical protein
MHSTTRSRRLSALHQAGILIKVRKGVYKYDPTAVSQELEDFTASKGKFL